MKKAISLLLGTILAASAGVVITWDYEPEYLASGPFEDILEVTQDFTNWTAVPPPYQTVTNHPRVGPGMKYFVPLQDYGFTNGHWFFRARRWWTDTNAHPMLP